MPQRRRKPGCPHKGFRHFLGSTTWLGVPEGKTLITDHAGHLEERVIDRPEGHAAVFTRLFRRLKDSPGYAASSPAALILGRPPLPHDLSGSHTDGIGSVGRNDG